jgi:hypothetical protein
MKRSWLRVGAIQKTGSGMGPVFKVSSGSKNGRGDDVDDVFDLDE